MRLRFTGTYTGKRTSITICGVTFEGREPSEVTGEEALRRLSNHPEFEAVPDIVAQHLGPIDEPVKAPKRGRPRKG